MPKSSVMDKFFALETLARRAPRPLAAGLLRTVNRSRGLTPEPVVT